MAKTYAESVKLPNLVSVPHPASRMGQFGKTSASLNVEGRASKSDKDLLFKSADRRLIITDLLGKNFSPAFFKTLPCLIKYFLDSVRQLQVEQKEC
jgi:hypothetical protein